jgi:hypothetical protein
MKHTLPGPRSEINACATTTIKPALKAALKHGKDSVNGWMALAHCTGTWATHFLRAVCSQHAPNSAPPTLPYCFAPRGARGRDGGLFNTPVATSSTSTSRLGVVASGRRTARAPRAVRSH